MKKGSSVYYLNHLVHCYGYSHSKRNYNPVQFSHLSSEGIEKILMTFPKSGPSAEINTTL